MRTRIPTSRAALRVRISTLDVLCAFVAPPLALYFSNAYILHTEYFSTVALYCAASFAFSLMAFLVFRVDDGISHYFSVHDALDILKAAVISQLLTTVAIFSVTRLEGIPRSTPIYQALILAAGLVSIRAIAQALHNGANITNGYRHAARENIIMIGATQLSSLYIKLLQTISSGQHRVIALLDDQPKLVGRSMAGTRIVASPHHLKSVIDEYAVHGIHTDRVIIGHESNHLTEEELKEISDVCAECEIKLDFVQQLIGLNGVQLGETSETSQLQPMSAPSFALPRYFRFRPIFDFFAALALTIVLSPLLLLAAALVFIDVGSPVMFWQQRIGQGGRRFLLHKFRTMPAPFDWRGNPLPKRNKVSWIGRLLRQMRLDELPQLLNILVGDMALIGPRPLLPEDQPSNPTTRLMIRPGITGWAQVNGGKFLTPEEKDQYDEYYIRNASLWFDLRILFMTIMVFFRFTNHSDHEVAAEDRVGFGAAEDRATASGAITYTNLTHREVESPPIGVVAQQAAPASTALSNRSRSAR